MIEQRLADGKLPAGPVVPAICRALAAFADEDYAACVRELAPVLGEVVRIGGSHAQRELIEDTFIVALMRSGELPRARACSMPACTAAPPCAIRAGRRRRASSATKKTPVWRQVPAGTGWG